VSTKSTSYYLFKILINFLPPGIPEYFNLKYKRERPEREREITNTENYCGILSQFKIMKYVLNYI